ncbi:uncharacterized protein Dsimw501_GD28718 [Drosophila simulans]|uniref:Uncharacterized protein n=1 Tax=Drosophila simulans TaxID=7240 RepID=A0A0J9QUH1_DROSI|nr:uncharacterized protein Dsimw501_GD28718 [Drosophila simulans]
MPRIPLPGSSLLVVLALILCLSPPSRAVPASVLAQDTELSTSANHKLQQQQQQPAAAKRSEEASAVPTADKKSSPEIVPASFSNAPSARNSPVPVSSQQQK